MAPIYEPAGFGEWEQSGSLITGFVAKEVVVGAMSQLYVPVAGGQEGSIPSLADDLAEIGRSFVEASGDTLKAIPAVFGLHAFEVSGDPSSHLRSAIETSFDRSGRGHGRAAGLAFMVFVLLYTPCMAAVAAFRHEFGTRWMWVSVIGQFGVAWLGALIAFQLGRLVL
jgi:ferrous iron transport protein B